MINSHQSNDNQLDQLTQLLIDNIAFQVCYIENYSIQLNKSIELIFCSSFVEEGVDG